jgi:hypothetical protein
VSGAQWRSAIEGTAGYFNNRMLMLTNWDVVAQDREALAGLREALTAPRAGFCNVSPTIDLGHAVFRDESEEVIGVGLMTSRNPSSEKTRLVVSTRPELDERGVLAAPDVENEEISPGSSFILSRPHGGRVHAQLVTEGCGGGKRIHSPVVALDLVPGAGGEVPHPRLFTRVERGRATLSWDVGDLAARQGYTARLQVSTDPTFAAVDGVDVDATGDHHSTSALRGGVTYHARLVVEGEEGARAVSNVEAFTP